MLLASNYFLEELKGNCILLADAYVRIYIYKYCLSCFSCRLLVAENILSQIMGLNGRKVICLQTTGFGFGNLTATYKSLPPGSEEIKLHESKLMKVASNIQERLVDRCCCKCFIQACSQVNERCTIIFTQLCTALACFQCLSCCCEIFDTCEQYCG